MMRAGSRAALARCHSLLILVSVFVSPSPAAEPLTLLDRPPFDQVVLNEANQGARLDVVPLQLPARPLRSLPTTGKLSLQLLDRPTEAFEVNWSDVAQIRVYEQMLMDEARRLTAAGDFDSAYDYFVRLSTDYQNFPGLDDAISDYLRRNAFALHQANQNDRALALLLTLYERNPRHPGLATAVETVAGEIMTQYLRSQQYAAARAVLDLWRIQFKDVAPEAATAWQRRFETAADRKLAEARQLAAQKQFVAARKAAQGALGIWPTMEQATALLAQIQRDYPFVSVAVFESSPRHPTRRIDDWAALRTSRLVERTLSEEIGFGSEGGVYHSPFGDWEIDDSGLVLTLKLAPGAGVNSGELARYLIGLADPGNDQFRGDLANLLEGVSTSSADSVQIHWRHPHVRPEALLQLPPPAEAETVVAAEVERSAGFRISDFQADQVVFTPTANGEASLRGGVQAIFERRMPNDNAAVEALLSSEVDVLDRVPPWKLDQLRAAQGVSVQEYRLPTVHVLIPNMNRPLPAKREFRRALCFGIDRKWIVERVILGGTKRPGFDVVSGPFPTGTSLSDPIRYGYNNQLAARPFEPRLAAILAEVAWTSVQATAIKESTKPGEKLPGGESPKNDKGEDDTDDKVVDVPEAPIPELVLAHASDPVARVACQSIELQLEHEGIPVRLVEYTSDELLAGQVECDLRYAELAMWEPVADSRLVLGPRGLANIDSPFLNSALRRLDQASNWKDVRSRLADIHRIVHHELPVIPLWQTLNYFAYRSELVGIGDAPLTLYQNVDNWQMSGEVNVAQSGTSQ